VDPATTAEADSFPTATIAAQDTGGVYAYSAFTTSGGEFLGISIPGQDPIIYSDPMTHVVFPCTYNTTWTDDFAADFSFGGVDFVRTGTVSATADAYGTLILPWGSISDVLRATYVEDYEDAGLITLSTHREYTYYMVAGTHYPLVQVYSFTSTVLGNSTTITGAQWMDETSTQVATVPVTPRLEAYPVPANDVLNVRLDGDGPATLELLDAQGRPVMHRSANGNGPRLVQMGTSNLSAGTYTLRVVRNGASAVRQVVLTH
jgi:hypothetical protein